MPCERFTASFEGPVKGEQTGRKHPGRKPALPDPDQAEPEDKDQYNFTDPDSRIMLDGATKGFTYAINAQIGVDVESGVIVGTYLTDHPNDKSELIPAIEAITTNTGGATPEKISADNGYFSEAVLGDSRVVGLDLYIPPSGARRKTVGPDGAESDGSHLPPDDNLSHAQTMRRKLQTPEGKDVYKMRKAIAEAPFGIIKSVSNYSDPSGMGCSPSLRATAQIFLQSTIPRKDAKCAEESLGLSLNH
ncbi:MAG: hypothetical protein ACOCYP_02080, partial [Planctomycetota bacterium]